jgi:uncharacterized membrane protein
MNNLVSNKFNYFFFTVNMLLIIITSLIILGSIIAPYFEIEQNIILFNIFNSIPSKICNQYPTHCFEIFGTNMGLCSRCQLLYFGFLVISITNIKYIFRVNAIKAAALFVLFVLPMTIDGLTQYYNYRVSNNVLRSVTGFLGGIGIYFLLYIPKALLGHVLATITPIGGK